MKALLKLRTQMEIDFLKTKTYEEINDMFNQLKDKLDIAESELKKLRVTDVSVSVCLHEPQYQNYNSETKLQICDKCGEITN
jgi:hypothetical protein